MAQELFMKEKLLSLHGVQRINDMEGNEVFEVRGKFFSIHDYMSLYDMEGKELAKIHKKVISLHETHFIEMDGKEVTELRTKLFHPFNQEIDLPEIGWQIRGSFLEHDFSIYDKEDQLRAVVHRKYISLGEGYQITITSDEDVVLVLAIIVALERIMADRRNARESGAIAAGTTAAAHANQQSENDQN